MYPAKNGDAFLIKQNSTNPVAILIDGGYAATFKNWISNDLKLLAQLGYSLNLVVVTHIDADHIAGLLEFFRLNGNSQAPKIIPVENVWHNSLRSLSSTTDAYDNQSADDKDLLTEILRRGYPMPVGEDEVEPVEISARQGSSLAALLLGGGYCWNIGKGMQSINSEEVPTLKLSQDFLKYPLYDKFPFYIRENTNNSENIRITYNCLGLRGILYTENFVRNNAVIYTNNH